MLNKIDENTYSFSVSSRESFTYQIQFDTPCVEIDYYCKTDNYHFKTRLKPDSFGLVIYSLSSTDYQLLSDLVKQSIDFYINHNVISGSVRRAWIKFKDELISIYNALVMSQNYRIL